MKLVQGALVASLSAASLSTSLSAAREVGRGRRRMDADYDLEDLVGLDDEAGYAEVARMFVGINPLNGIGSGFPVIGDEVPRITSPEFPMRAPFSNDGRNDMCTCDCKPSPDGVGCVGYGAIQFRWSNMLWKDPVSGDWDGRMQCWQPDPEFDPVDPMPMPPPNEFNFLGSDRRIYPGGPVIFVIAGTDDMTTNDLSGVFRQGHDAVSCRAGLSDYFRNDQGAEVDTTTCAYRCRNADTYIEWLEYCAADEEDTSLGFSGYDM
mmetsp:Transcript_15923/g.36435  ORF Transcript_15923/g.36435 Transcript_15923/m.36435 type:complete len:263 (+) Transcript_15923:91-879(+)